jgi:hypothetical protein
MVPTSELIPTQIIARRKKARCSKRKPNEIQIARVIQPIMKLNIN